MRLRKAKPDLEEEKESRLKLAKGPRSRARLIQGETSDPPPPRIPAVRVPDGPSALPEPQSAASPGTTKYPDVEVSAFFISGGGEENYFFWFFKVAARWNIDRNTGV